MLDVGMPLGLLLSTSMRHVLCFHGWLHGTSALLYALGTASFVLKLTLRHALLTFKLYFYV